jgi:hypothetical protein
MKPIIGWTMLLRDEMRQAHTQRGSFGMTHYTMEEKSLKVNTKGPADFGTKKGKHE